MAQDSPREPLSPTTRNGDIPTVIISEPGSPDFVGKGSDDDDSFSDDDEDLEGLRAAMNHEFDFSSFTLNQQGLEEVLPQIVPPDGGYGWVIVFAAFISNAIVDGICTSFSEFKQSYKDKFEISDALTALIGSLLIGTYLLIGPVGGAVMNKYGARTCVIIGALVGGFGFLFSLVVPSVTLFLFFYGIVGGIGFGFIYLPSIVIVSQYFESRRAIATGIAVAGSGVGTIVIPLLSKTIIQGSTWAFAQAVLACLVFSCAALGMLYRPLTGQSKLSELGKDYEMEPLKDGMRSVNDDTERSGTGHDSLGKRISQPDMDDNSSMTRLRNALSECDNEDAESETGTVQKPTPLSPVLEGAQSKSRAGTVPYPAISATRPRKLTISSMASGATSRQDLNNSRSNLVGGNLGRISARSFATSLSRLSQRDQSTLSIALSGVDPQEFSRPMNRKDIFYTGSISNLKEFKQEGGNMSAYRSSTISIPRSVLAQANAGIANGDMESGSRMGGSVLSRFTGGLGADEFDMEDFEDKSNCKWIPLPIRNALSEMIDVQLLKDTVMMLLCISNILGMMGFYIPFMFLKDLAVANHDGVETPNASYLVPLIGLLNTVGRVFFGWFADLKYISSLTMNNMALLLCGILTMAAPIGAHSDYYLFAYSSLFGFFISAYVTLTSIVLSDLLGTERLTNSFGLLVVARGVACLAGPPFAGMVYDVTKSYSACFYFAGLMIAAAGGVSCIIPCVHRCQRSQGKNEGEFGADNVSGKLSVVSERSEENLTEYQRTIQSLRQQYALIKEFDDEKRKCREQVDEEDEDALSNNEPVRQVSLRELQSEHKDEENVEEEDVEEKEQTTVEAAVKDVVKPVNDAEPLVKEEKLPTNAEVETAKD